MIWSMLFTTSPKSIKLYEYCIRVCVQQNIFPMFSVKCRQFSYLCKDKVQVPGNGTADITSSADDPRHEDKLFHQDLSEEDLRRRNLQIKSLSFLAMVDKNALNPKQLEIHQAHVRALKAGYLFYTDPATGYDVMTRLAHLHRGNCCGSACRHEAKNLRGMAGTFRVTRMISFNDISGHFIMCPFGQKEAPKEHRKVYNSAFYE